MDKNVLDISWATILKIALTVLAFYLIYQISEILVLFVFAVIISVLVSPAIKFLERFKLPRPAAVIGVYLSVFTIFGLFIYLSIPVFSQEVKEFSRLIPGYIDTLSPYLQGIGVEAFESIESFLDTIQKSTEMIATNVFQGVAMIFGGVFSTLFVITMAIFLSLEEGSIEKSIKLLFPEDNVNEALAVWQKARLQVTNWFFVRLLACLFVGVTSYIAFYLFNVQYAFLFALIGGVFNFVVYVGPAIAAVLFFVVILMDSMWKAIFALLAFIIIQLIESSILTPVLSKKYMGVSPVLVLIAITAGGVLWGFLGAILAIPLLGILAEFLKKYLSRQKT